MEQIIVKVVSNKTISNNIFEMKLNGSFNNLKPGQFINIKIKNCYLRRPISICNHSKDTITIIYKVVGKGTDLLSKLKKNEELDILTNLGNGYDLTNSGVNPILIGGGVGIPPLYYLAKELLKLKIKPIIILGFNTKDDIFYIEEFKKLNIKIFITTIDGSIGAKGLVTDALKQIDSYSYIYTCGPEKMLKAVYDVALTPGEYSFEARMGCGFGACMGCSCKIKYGSKRICKDGPVLKSEEIIW